MVARGRLRQLIGRYLDLPPAYATFAFTEYGKLYLSPQPGQPDLRFNVPIRSSLRLLAFAWGRRPGVHIEVILPTSYLGDLVRRFFCSGRSNCLGGRAPAQQVEAFFNGWMHKEALIKAIGQGLSYPQD
jgi:4'-phosphopantetheinyl transferase